jgi:hypothetical protein
MSRALILLTWPRHRIMPSSRWDKASKLTAPTHLGTKVFGNAVLHGPLGMVRAPNNNLIVANGDGISPDPTHPSEYVEFAKSGGNGVLIDEFNIDPNLGGAFGIDAGLLSDTAARGHRRQYEHPQRLHRPDAFAHRLRAVSGGRAKVKEP